MVKPRVKQTKLSGLRPHEKNPRDITAARMEELKASLVADELMLEARPLVALPDGRAICGNQRLAAAEALGWSTIPCVTVDLDDATAELWMPRRAHKHGAVQCHAVNDSRLSPAIEGSRGGAVLYGAMAGGVWGTRGRRFESGRPDY